MGLELWPSLSISSCSFAAVVFLTRFLCRWHVSSKTGTRIHECLTNHGGQNCVVSSHASDYTTAAPVNGTATTTPSPMEYLTVQPYEQAEFAGSFIYTFCQVCFSALRFTFISLLFFLLCLILSRWLFCASSTDFMESRVAMMSWHSFTASSACLLRVLINCSFFFPLLHKISKINCHTQIYIKSIRQSDT